MKNKKIFRFFGSRVSFYNASICNRIGSNIKIDKVKTLIVTTLKSRCLHTSATSFTFTKSYHTQREKKASIGLVRECFGPNTDAAYENYYDWQYLQNPIGQGTVLLVYDGDTAIAQEAFIPCKYQAGNRFLKVVLRMNACVCPAYRRKGLLLEIKRHLHKYYGRPALSIGIPNASNSSSRRSSYYPMRLTLLIRPLRLSNYFHNYLAKSVMKPFDNIWRYDRNYLCEDLDTFDESFDELARVTYSGEIIRQIRDSNLLNWRYINNPRRRYKIFAVMDSDRKLEGYIVLRVTEIAGMKVGLIMDFASRYDKSDSGRRLVSAALDFFWSNDVVFALACCFPNNIEYQLLRKGGFLKCPDRFRPHPLTIWMKLFDEGKLDTNTIYDSNRWFFMLGDYETF